MVFDNLGLDAADLGADDLDTGGDDQGDGDQDGEQFLGPDDARDGQDDQGGQRQREGSRGQLDDLRVSHTRDRERGRPFPKNAEVRADQNGNLIDPRSGSIVAKAGREAALYQQGFKSGENARVGGLTYRLQQRENQLRQAIDAGRKLQTQIQQFTTQQETLKQYNLQPSDQLSAMKLWSDLKKDPKQTIMGLLTRAAAMGINVQELGAQGGSFDLKSVTDLIQEEIRKATQPITEQNQRQKEESERQRQQEEVARKTEGEVNQFFADNPEALRYHQVFERTLQNPEFRHMSLGEIWARIQLSQLRNSQNGTRRQNRRFGGRPSGRPAPMGDARNVDAPAPASQTYDQILRAVMDQQGIR